MFKTKLAKIIDFFLKNIFFPLPVKQNKIVFNNFSGKGFGDNPKYIALQLLRDKADVDMVWIVKNMNESVPKGIRLVKNHSLRCAYEMSTAKVWIDDVRNAFKPRKKRKQYYIQTWHGTVDVKKVEGQVVSKLGSDYVRDAKKDGQITDLMISNGSYTTKRYHKWYWYNGEVLESGNPRMDILINPSNCVKKKVYQFFDIPDDYKIIIYAPTFRKLTINSSDSVDVYKFNYSKVLKTVEKKFGSKFKMLVRLHPNIEKNSNKLHYSDEVINASSYDDMQELLAASEVLITDYSSCMFDFILSKKPVFLYAKDYALYKNYERGFNFDLKKLPASFSTNEDQLINSIEEFNKRLFSNECVQFVKKLGIHESGKASRIVAKKIYKIIDSENNLQQDR